MTSTWLSRLVRWLTSSPPPICDEEMKVLRERTEAGQALAEERDPEVREVSTRLRWQRETNHFGPLIWAALRGETDG